MNNIISVDGFSKIRIEPDLFVLEITIEEFNKKKNVLIDDTSKQFCEIKNILINNNIDISNLITSEFKIERKRRELEYKSKEVGFVLTRTFQVNLFSDYKKVTSVLNKLFNLKKPPSIRVESYLKNNDKYQDILIKKAIEDALRKANVIVSTLNVELGEIVNVNYSKNINSNIPFPVTLMGRKMLFSEDDDDEIFDSIKVEPILLTTQISVQWQIIN